MPVLVPAKKLRKFSRVGKKKKVHTPSGIRTHDHCSTSPDPSPLGHPARRCRLPFFAKFIHLKPIILTLVNNRSPKPKPLELVNNRSPKPKPFVNNRLPKPNPPATSLTCRVSVSNSLFLLLLATYRSQPPKGAGIYRSRELCRLFKPYILGAVPGTLATANNIIIMVLPCARPRKGKRDVILYSTVVLCNGFWGKVFVFVYVESHNLYTICFFYFTSSFFMGGG